jgi:hypothetical protein
MFKLFISPLTKEKKKKSYFMLNLRNINNSNYCRYSISEYFFIFFSQVLAYIQFFFQFTKKKKELKGIF